VVGLRDEDGGAHFVGLGAEVPSGVERFSKGAEASDEIANIDSEFGGVYFHSGKEFVLLKVRELRKLDEISCVVRNIRSDFCNDAALVWAVYFENESFHTGAVKSGFGVKCDCFLWCVAV